MTQNIVNQMWEFGKSIFSFIWGNILPDLITYQREKRISWARASYRNDSINFIAYNIAQKKT